jgi:ribosomal protein S20
MIVGMQSVADLDRLAADLGIVHKNAAAHKKSQFTLALNKLA